MKQEIIERVIEWALVGGADAFNGGWASANNYEDDVASILAVLEAAQRYAVAFDATGNAETMEQERVHRAEQLMARDALLALFEEPITPEAKP